MSLLSTVQCVASPLDLRPLSIGQERVQVAPEAPWGHPSGRQVKPSVHAVAVLTLNTQCNVVAAAAQTCDEDKVSEPRSKRCISERVSLQSPVALRVPAPEVSEILSVMALDVVVPTLSIVGAPGCRFGSTWTGWAVVFFGS